MSARPATPQRRSYQDSMQRRSSNFCNANLEFSATPPAEVAISVKTNFHRGSALMAPNNKEKPPKAIFFDAAGTLFHLSGTVGRHYAIVGNKIGLTLNAHQLGEAFYSVWKKMPRRVAIDCPRKNDDKGWWRELA